MVFVLLKSFCQQREPQCLRNSTLLEFNDLAPQVVAVDRRQSTPLAHFLDLGCFTHAHVVVAVQRSYKQVSTEHTRR